MTEAASPTINTFRWRAMNTNVELLAPEDCASFAEEAWTWFEEAEARFSRFFPNSELSRINRSAGRLCLISEPMLEVLQLAEKYRQLTDGLFQPFILQALKAAGYDRSFEQVKDEHVRLLSEANDRMLTEIGMNLDPGMKSVLLPPGAAIDLGGIAKSWTVRKTADRLRRSRKLRRGLLNAGGDLMAWGESGDEPWLIGIENPWSPVEELGMLALTNGAAATSSTLGRRWTTTCGPMHHLIDPRTRKPSASDVIQCTVAGPDPVQCEVWAKAFCIAGTGDGVGLFHRKAPGYEAALFTKDEQIVYCGDADSPESRWQDVPFTSYEWREIT